VHELVLAMKLDIYEDVFRGGIDTGRSGRLGARLVLVQAGVDEGRLLFDDDKFEVFEWRLDRLDVDDDELDDLP
jgi:hypothetical protein